MCLGVSGMVLSIEESPLGVAMGRVSFGGIVKEVCLAYVPEARAGDYVIVHAGFALSRLGEVEAMEVFEIARRREVIFASFGDMLRVPGSETDLLGVKAIGGDVRIVYSQPDALKLAQKHPDRQVVFFAVGFETTAPGERHGRVAGRPTGPSQLLYP